MVLSGALESGSAGFIAGSLGSVWIESDSLMLVLHLLSAHVLYSLQGLLHCQNNRAQCQSIQPVRPDGEHVGL